MNYKSFPIYFAVYSIQKYSIVTDKPVSFVFIFGTKNIIIKYLTRAHISMQFYIQGSIKERGSQIQVYIYAISLSLQFF